MMTVLKTATLVLLAGFTAAHLAGSWKENEKLRRITKPFLLIFILAFYLLRTDKPSIWLTLALLTSWLGDVLLIPSGTPWFISGGISFLISHILFIFVYLPKVGFQTWYLWILIPAAILYYGISVKVTLTLKEKLPKMMLAPMILYLLANSTMNLFALAQLLTLKNLGAAIAYVGAVMFFTSDCTLYLVRYHKNKDLIFKKHFTVMLTDLLGEALITVVVLLLG